MKPSAKDRIAWTVEDAEEQIAELYWEACDAAQAALDPTEVTDAPWAQQFLADTHQIARAIAARPEPWPVARVNFDL